VDNVEIFSAGLVADAGTGESIHNPAAESCHSSYSVAMSRQPAFVLDLEDNQPCVADS
jgi:hypothetical protein